MREQTRSSFLFFASGILASAGVNLLTSLAGSQTLEPWIIGLWASQWLLSSAALATAASHLEHAAREADSADRPELTRIEREALRRYAASPYVNTAKAWTAVATLFFTIAIALIFLLPAERISAAGRTAPMHDTQPITRTGGRVVIVHGAYGSPDENWFPWLATELRARGVRVDVPTFPTPEGQSLSAWRSAFQNQVGPTTPDMVLVGHSLGPAFILQLLSSTQTRIRGTFLVAPFVEPIGIERFDVPNRTFLTRPLDWASIRARAGFVRVYGSDNDPYVSAERTGDVARGLGTSVTRIAGGGHFNTAAGYATFPQLLHDLMDFLEK